MTLLPNQWSATPRSNIDPPLRLWNTGDPLTASALNGNFLLVLGIAQAALTAATNAVPLTEASEKRIRALVQRAEMAEQAHAAHVRALEPYATLRTAAALQTQIGQLHAGLHQAVAHLEERDGANAMLAFALCDAVEEIETREPPPTPSIEEFEAVCEVLDATIAQAVITADDACELQERIQRLELQASRRRQNVLEYAPMALLGALQKQIAGIAAQLELVQRQVALLKAPPS